MIQDFLSKLKPKSHVMALGNVGTKALDILVEAGHGGVLVTDLQEVWVDGFEVIQARIGPDSCMTKLLDGYWIRPITLPEIINQLPGPYDAVICSLNDRNRMVALSDTLKAMYPMVAAFPEDGHNEGVIAEYKRRGYRDEVVDGWLLLWRSA